MDVDAEGESCSWLLGSEHSFESGVVDPLITLGSDDEQVFGPMLFLNPLLLLLLLIIKCVVACSEF